MKLQEAMEEAFGDFYRLDQFLWKYFGCGIDRFLRGGAIDQVIGAVITKYEADGRRALVDFLEIVAKNTPNEYLALVCRGTIDGLPELKFGHLETSHPWQTLFPGERAYFNRKNVRQRFAELVSPHATRTLAIAGPPESGKSHSGKLVPHLEERVSPPFRHVWVDLVDDVDTSYNAQAFMRSMALRMEWDDEKLKEPHTIKELRDWFVGRLNAKRELWWLVIDGISQVDLGHDVRDLIRALVKEAERSEYLRLILLGCIDPAIIGAGDRVSVETLEPVDEKDIHDFLTTAFTRSKVNVSIDQQAIDALVQLIFHALPADTKTRMRVIEERVAKVVLNQEL